MKRANTGRTSLAVTLSLAIGSFAVPATGAESVVEEIVVTGSYIKRSTADSPSPLTVIDRAQIEQVGAIEVADIVNRMTFNSGSTNQTNAFSGGDNSTGQTNINLRNLGLGSTLVLINGKRYAKTSTDSGGNSYVNTSTLIPSIAIGRVEVVKDGASALYGSDAVAGVVNFITRNDFDGMEISFDARTDQETGKQDDLTFSTIFGMSGDRGSIVASAEYLERKPLKIDDRFSDFGGTGLSSLANPGNFSPIGLGAAVTSAAPAYIVGGGGIGDIDCDLAASQHRQSFRSPVSGTPLASGGIEANNGCIYDFSPFFALVGAETRFLSHVSGEFDVSDGMQIYGEMSYADQKFTRENSMFPLVRFPVLPANHPGLQADLARRNANLVAAGSPLAGVLTTPGNVGGAVFFGRPLGFTPDDTGSNIRPIDTNTREFGETYRAILGVRGDMPFGDTWTFDTSFTRSQRNQSTRGTDTDQQKLLNAVSGFGGSNCNPNLTGSVAGSGNAGNIAAGRECYYYNPFFSGFFQPDGTTQTDPMLANPRALYDWMIGEFRTGSETTQLVWDFVTTGDLFEMPNGQTVGMAMGLQWRKDETSLEIDDTSNDGGFSFIFGGTNWDGKENTYAAFVEFAIPVSDRIEFQLAGRYERFDEIDQDSFDPKLTGMWSATDSLTLRGSVGTSYRVGSLLQTNGFSTQLINIADPFSGAGLAFRPEIAQGNQDLEPESAFVWNIGLSYAPEEGMLEGLSVDLDYYSYDYEDLIARPGAASLIAEDIASRCPQGLNNGLDPTRPNCGIQASTTQIAFDPNGGPGVPDQIIRDENGNYLRAQPTFSNAQELKTSGMDFNINYQWETDGFGLFTAGVAASWTEKYEITDINGNSFDGAGKRNIGTTIGRTLPEWKVNYTLSWLKDRHSVFALVRYIHSYKDDQNIQRDSAGNPRCVGSCLRAVNFGISDLLNDKIDSFTTLDLQYSYELPAWGIQAEGSRVSIGGVNVTNETPPKLNTDGGFDPFVHDSRGAMWYARYTMQL